MIEVPCRVDARGVHQLPVNLPPLHIQGLIDAVSVAQTLTIQAAVTGDRRTALQALLAHPLIPSFETARSLLAALLSAHRDYLPQFELYAHWRKCMKPLKIAVIGGGSTYTPELIDGFARYNAELPVDCIVLHDIDAQRLEIVGGLARRMLQKSGLAVHLTTVLAEALDGADFVITQLRVGGMAARALG